MVYIDFSEVSDSFELMPEGNYEATVSKIEQKIGKDSGKPYLSWEFDCTEDDYVGRKFFFNTSLQPSGLWKLKELLVNAFGMDPDVLASDFDLEPEELIGVPVICVVTHREWNGRTTENVENVLPAANADITFE